MLRSAAAGLVLGVLWGTAARVWMRLIATEPEFSWAGTLFIIGLAAWLGLLLGMARGARLTGRRAAWRLAVGPGLLLFVGPGAPFLPGFGFGAMAWSGRWPRWFRLGCLVLAFSGLLFLLPADAAGLDHVNPLVSFGGFILLSAGLAYGGSHLFRRWPSRAGVARVEHVLSA